MSLYVLDTDTLTLLQIGHPLVRERASLRHPSELATTIISVEEQFLGWHTRLRRAKQADEIARIYQRFTGNVQALARVQILSFMQPAIARNEQLKALKLNVGTKDLRIAAIALEHAGVLVTGNSASRGSRSKTGSSEFRQDNHKRRHAERSR